MDDKQLAMEHVGAPLLEADLDAKPKQATQTAKGGSVRGGNGIRFCGGISNRRDHNGDWVVRARLRVNGRIVEARDQVPGTREAAKKRREELKCELRSGRPAPVRGSLKGLSTFGDLVRFRVELVGYGGMANYYKRVADDLGDAPNDPDDFLRRFGDYMRLVATTPSKWTGKVLAPKSRNHIVEVTAMTWAFAAKPANRPITGVYINPMAGYDKLPDEPRDRVLDPSENNRLFNGMLEVCSPLYWAARFAAANPIRQADQMKLTRANLDRTSPWVHFMPNKTRKRKPRETCLVCIEEEMLAYWESLPRDCPYLFPWMNDDGSWRQMAKKDFQDHWQGVRACAGIANFTWHDLKHMAVTSMLDNGFTERDLKNLGIQYDPRMIDRYYHCDARKALKKWKQYSGQDMTGELAELVRSAAHILTGSGFSEEQLRDIGLKFCPKFGAQGAVPALVPEQRGSNPVQIVETL